jgi:hypothetical protein
VYITIDNGHGGVGDVLNKWKDIESHSELALAENRFNQPDLSDHPIYLFTFMRNPYARVISTYEYRFRIWPDRGESQPQLLEIDKIDGNISFKEYIDVITTIGDNQRWMPQTNWMHPLINYVGKTETLAEDVKIIADNIGLPEKEKNDLDLTLKENISRWRHKNYKDYYDDESRKKVEKYYERDIDFLKVKF